MIKTLIIPIRIKIYTDSEAEAKKNATAIGKWIAQMATEHLYKSSDDGHLHAWPYPYANPFRGSITIGKTTE